MELANKPLFVLQLRLSGHLTRGVLHKQVSSLKHQVLEGQVVGDSGEEAVHECHVALHSEHVALPLQHNLRRTLLNTVKPALATTCI